MIDYMITTHDNIANCARCDMDLTSDLIGQYGCVGLLSDACRALNDHNTSDLFLHTARKSITTSRQGPGPS